MSNTPTFEELSRDPSRFSPILTYPAVQPGAVTVIWRGGSTRPLYCMVEWLDTPQPLTYLPALSIWGADIPAPALPRDVCSSIAIGPLEGERVAAIHMAPLTGPATPAPIERPASLSPLLAEIEIPSPGLATASRRVRLFAPAGSSIPRIALLVLDGEAMCGAEEMLPATLDALRERGEAPPVLVVAADAAPGVGRQSEYLMDGADNPTASAWLADTLIPTIASRYGVERWLIAGWSNSASMALQMSLRRPDRFAGAAAFSPFCRGGFDTLLALAQSAPETIRVALTNGGFGPREAANQPNARALARALTMRSPTIHYHEAPSYGHNRLAWSLLLPDALRWLLTLS